VTVVASAYARQDFELYETEAWATDCLLDFLKLPEKSLIWESSAGNHKIADVLRKRRYLVITSDVTRHTRDHDFIADFYSDFAYPSVHGLITNPPYGLRNTLAVRYARLCLERCDGWVALLLTAKFDSASTRQDLFANNPRFYAKLTLVDRIQWFEGDSQGTEDHAWFIWGPAPGVGIGNAKIAYGANPDRRTSSRT
jgi:hypothetical protein